MAVGITERGDGAIHFDHWLAKHSKPSIDLSIIITKAPTKILERLTDLPSNTIVHCTITGWGGTPLEPNVQPAHIELQAYEELCNQLGAERVVLRVDPVIPTTIGINRAKNVVSHRRGRVRMSILDLYPHVRLRLKTVFRTLLAELEAIYPTHAIDLQPKLRADIFQQFEDIEICGEPGFPSVGCVSERDFRALGLRVPEDKRISNQRSACKCLASKRELLGSRQQCAHQCAYCYWRS